MVDNGPSEQPSSPLVQMVLVKLVRLLNLDKITQVSFAEYHSKRNYIERVHAEENRVLSSHGPFCSKVPNKQATPGTLEHKQNMENMAEEVKKCITQGSFGGNQLLAFRGVKCEDFVFNDQKELQQFLDLSEDIKELFTPESYSAAQDSILNNLHFIWGANRPFTGTYLHNYRALRNDLKPWMGQERLGLTSTQHLCTLQMETATADDTSYSHFLTISGGLKPMSCTTYHSKRGAY